MKNDNPLVAQAPAPAAPPDTQAQLLEKLRMPVTLRGHTGNTPLKDVLEFVSDRWDLKIRNPRDMENAHVREIESSPIQLPTLHDVSLAALLRIIGRQMNCVFMVTKSELVLVPEKEQRSRRRDAGWLPLPAPLTGKSQRVWATLDRIVSAPAVAGNPIFVNGLDRLTEVSDAAGGSQQKLSLWIDHLAFASKQRPAPEGLLVTLPELRRVRVRDELQRLCEQVQAAFRVEDNIVWITPRPQ